MHIDIDGFTLQLQRKRVKNINLRIYRSGELRVSAPHHMPMAHIQQFINTQRPWISRQQQRLQALPEPNLPKFETGTCVYFLGQAYTLLLQTDTKNPRVVLTEQELTIFSKPSPIYAKKCLSRWYHEQMLQYLPELITHWEGIIGVKAKNYVIKAMKSRWGSCQPLTQKITLNLRLIEKPLICLAYVLVHELVHLLEPSHNKRFHALMTSYMPEWKSVKAELRHS